MLNKEIDDPSIYACKLYDIFIKNRNNFLKVGFTYKHNDDSIMDNNFWAHFTRRNIDNNAYQFLIRKLDNGEMKIPDDVYFSEKYPQEQRKNSNKEILKEFIKYLRQKI